MQAAAGKRLAVGRGHDHVEIRIGAVGERTAGEGRLDADHRRRRRNRQRQLALDGAAAGFRHGHGDARFQRAAGDRHFVERDRETRFALRIGLGQIGKLLAYRRDLVVRHAEGITGKARPLLGNRNRHVAGQFQFGSRRAIEEMAVHAGFCRRRAVDRFRLRREIEFDAVGHIVLDHERGLADRRTFGIGVGLHAPSTGRGRSDNRHAPAAAAEALIGNKRAAIFDTVRPLHDQGQRRARSRLPSHVAQQRGDRHGLTAAIDAALGIDEGIEACRLRPAADAAIG